MSLQLALETVPEALSFSANRKFVYIMYLDSIGAQIILKTILHAL